MFVVYTAFDIIWCRVLFMTYNREHVSLIIEGNWTGFSQPKPAQYTVTGFHFSQHEYWSVEYKKQFNVFYVSILWVWGTMIWNLELVDLLVCRKMPIFDTVVSKESWRSSSFIRTLSMKRTTNSIWIAILTTCLGHWIASSVV